MKKLFTLFTLASLTLLTSCAKIYFTDDAFELAEQHETIAIIPPTISIAAKKKVDAEAIQEQQRTESLNFQKEMFAWMLKRKMKGQIQAEILDIETTNAMLEEAGFNDKTIAPKQLCEILGVNGVLTSNFGLSKPMSDGAAIAVAVLGGGGGATNEVKVSLSIHDGTNKKMIWNYDHKVSGGLGSSPSRIVDDVMRHASKKMPYFKK